MSIRVQITSICAQERNKICEIISLALKAEGLFLTELNDCDFIIATWKNK